MNFEAGMDYSTYPRRFVANWAVVTTTIQLPIRRRSTPIRRPFDCRPPYYRVCGSEPVLSSRLRPAANLKTVRKRCSVLAIPELYFRPNNDSQHTIAIQGNAGSYPRRAVHPWLWNCIHTTSIEKKHLLTGHYCINLWSLASSSGATFCTAWYNNYW